MALSPVTASGEVLHSAEERPRSAVDGIMLTDIRALAFDVFGTVVDWRTGVAREAAAVLRPKGYDADFGAFADAWRALYVPAMAKVRSGARRWTILDVLHRENLVEVLR